MEQTVSTDMRGGGSLPLSSLRLLVPPLQLMTASMWRVLESRDVSAFWKVADFVSLVVEMVPELLLHRHQTQLDLGLRARYILELCRTETRSEFISPFLEKMKSTLSHLKESEEEELILNFLEMVQALLKDPEERRIFFLEVFPSEYGPAYLADLQVLFWEFLCRLAQLLPAPDLQQTVSWLAAENSALEDCVQTVSRPTDLKNLLQHHKNLGHLEQHVPPSSMGDSIVSSLSAVLHSKVGTPLERPSRSETPPSLHDDDAHIVSFIDDVAVEIVTATDYSETELGASADVEAATEERCVQEEVRGAELKEEEEEEGSRTAASRDDSASWNLKTSPGRHECPDCEKKFRFASSLTAHRVIHTGERPHRCADCGRCFSFRQSLDRHRHTHKTQRSYDCVVCGESFHSLSARTQHKQTHTRAGGYACRRCSRTFRWEPALARHLKTHGEDGEPAGGPDTPPDLVTAVRTSGRKRRPTLKVQVIDLQRRMAAERRRENATANAPALKPAPFNCVEHSYGSDVVSSADGDEVSAADRPRPAVSCSEGSDQPSEEQRAAAMLTQPAEATPTQPAEATPTQPAEATPTDEEGQLACGACERSFRFRSLLAAHQRSHTGEQPFACAQCGQRFSFKQSLERHKQTHASGRRYRCPICGEGFGSLAARRQHRDSHMENGEYPCSECGRAFAWKSALVRHLKTHDAAAAANKARRDYKCPHCELGFSCAGSLSRHLQTHGEERVHACNCGKSFAHRAALTAHQRTHQTERPHACAQCGKSFLYRGGLRSHMKIHSEEMPFACSHCGKSFKRERNMKKHERCHTRENVFSCSQCDKSFVYKATLTRHELTHSGERPFLCSDCGKGFFSHAELLKHERFHTGHKPFQCAQCGKRFTQSCYLTVHLRYHSGARPYACAECDKSFLSANRLKRHQRTHSGEKPYQCGECGKGFRQSYNLKVHQRTHVIKLP